MACDGEPHHDGQGDGWPAPTELWADAKRYSPSELGALQVMRHFFVSYADPEGHSWEQAFATGCARLGDDGGELCVAIVEVIQAMRTRRRSTFSFCNPFCENCRRRLTYCERDLLEVIRATRMSEPARARVHSLMLCEGHADDRFFASVRRMNAMLAIRAT